MADDFSEALKMFTGAVQDYQIQNAFKDATTQFKQLSQNETDLFKRRQAEEQFAKDLTQNMLGMGASPEQVKMGFQTFMPKSMTGSKDFFSAAANTPEGKDRQALLARGKELQAQEDAMTPYQREQIRLGEAELGLKRQLGEMKHDSAGRPEIKTLTAEQVKDIQNTDTQLTGMQGIFSKVTGENSPMSEMPTSKLFNSIRGMLDSDFADFKAQVGQQFQEYRKSITGAGASEGELTMLEKNKPLDTDSKEVFVKKMKTNMIIGEKIRKRNLETLGKAGYNVSGFSTTPLTSTGKSVLYDVDTKKQQLAILKEKKPNSPAIQKLETELKALQNEYMIGE